MKRFGILVLVFPLALMAAPRKIELHTEKVGDAVHWKPDTIEVTPGESISIVAKHDLEGGFDFHGLFIPELKINDVKVDRHKEMKPIERTVPKTLKPGEYSIGCQFHPKHVAAKLVVKDPAAAK